MKKTAVLLAIAAVLLAWCSIGAESAISTLRAKHADALAPSTTLRPAAVVTTQKPPTLITHLISDGFGRDLKNGRRRGGFLEIESESESLSELENLAKPTTKAPILRMGTGAPTSVGVNPIQYPDSWANRLNRKLSKAEEALVKLNGENTKTGMANGQALQAKLGASIAAAGARFAEEESEIEEF